MPPERRVAIGDVWAASQRIAPFARRTPLLDARDRAAGTPLAGRLHLKLECLQATGSFKLRGACNALARLADEGADAVVAHSSGNHAQAVARGARLLGLRATVVMPDDAPAVKVAGARGDGAQVIQVGPSSEERVRCAQQLARDSGAALVASANDADVIAGQGTVGLELVEQLRALAAREAGRSAPPTVLAPIGGGALAAGVAIAVKSLWPDARVYGVEPELAADARESLSAGRVVRWESELTGRTVADGLRLTSLAPLAFAHLARRLDGVLCVSEQQIADAVARAAFEHRVVAEPSGAAALAAAHAHAERLPAEGPVVVLISGGNVDPAKLAELLAAAGGGLPALTAPAA